MKPTPSSARAPVRAVPKVKHVINPSKRTRTMPCPAPTSGVGNPATERGH